MSNHPTFWKRSLAGIVLCTTFGVGAESSAQQKQAQPPGAAPAPVLVGPGGIAGEGAADEELVLKVFKLKLRDPDTVVNVANRFLSVRSGVGMPVFGEGAFAPGPGIGAPGGRSGFGEGPSGVSPVRLAADKRTRTLIARGPAYEVQVVADLVAILDVQDGQTSPKVKNLRIFRLKHADSRTILNVLAQLEITTFPGTRAEADPHTNSLIVMGEADLMRQIAQVIQVLDVESEVKTTK